MKKYNNFSDKNLDNSADESNDEKIDDMSDESGDEVCEGGKFRDESEINIKKIEDEGEDEGEDEDEGESEGEGEGEGESEDEDDEINDLDEIIKKLKEQINSEKYIEKESKNEKELQEVQKVQKEQEQNISIVFLNDKNLEKIQNEYLTKIQNLNKNVTVTFKIPEKLIRTKVFTFFKCWRNGYCLNSSNTKIPKNVKKVLFKKN